MPRKTDAVPIGVAPCMACGHDNNVYQNSKLYLYMRGCKGCGSADQRISDLVQTTMYYTLKTGEGAVVERPRNVPENRPAWLDKKEPAPVVAPVPVPTPVPEPVPTPAPVAMPPKKGKGGLLFLILASVTGVVVAGISIITNTTPRAAT